MINSKITATKIGIAASMLGMVVALSGVTSGFAAGSSIPTEGDSTAGSASTSASVVVPPWCGWNINPVVSSITLAPADSAKYLGVDLALTGSTSSINAYVGATTGATEAPAADNCSWFGKTPQAAKFDVTIASGDDKFTATSGATVDAGMGWALSVKPLVIANTFATGCAGAGFTPNVSPTASMAAAGTNTAWTIDSDDVTTNDFCSYSVQYTATVPGGKQPVYGNSTYTFTGPTLVHTLTTS
jgi:hypothetical protein